MRRWISSLPARSETPAVDASRTAWEVAERALVAGSLIWRTPALDAPCTAREIAECVLVAGSFGGTAPSREPKICWRSRLVRKTAAPAVYVSAKKLA